MLQPRQQEVAPVELLRLVVARDALRVALRVVARRLLDLLIVLRDPLRVPARQ